MGWVLVMYDKGATKRTAACHKTSLICPGSPYDVTCIGVLNNQ
jgi:hypothetical protein